MGVGFSVPFFLCKIVAECFCHLEYQYCNLCFVFLSQSCLVIIDLETHTQWIRGMSRGFLLIVIGGLMLKVKQGVQFVKAVKMEDFFYKGKKRNTIFHPDIDLYFNLFDLNSQTLL